MERNDYVEKYLDAYKEMREAAIEKMKNYGKVLDLEEVTRKCIADYHGISESDIGDDEVEDSLVENSYSCVFEGKHGFLYCCNIRKVRYNKETKDLDVFLESDERDFSDWYDVSCIGFERDAIYMTVHEYLASLESCE